MDIFVFSVVSLVGAIGLLVGISHLLGRRGASMMAELKARYPNSHIAHGFDDDSYAVVDYEHREVVLGCARGRISNQTFKYERTYPFGALVGAELKENDISVEKINRGSQVAGAAVGAVVLGGAGAVIGGLSASKTMESRVTAIEVLVTVADTAMPLHRITYLKLNSGVANATVFVNQARELVAHLQNAMRQSKTEAVAS